MSILTDDYAPKEAWEAVVVEFLGLSVEGVSFIEWRRIDWTQVPGATADIAYFALSNYVKKEELSYVTVIRQGDDVWLSRNDNPAIMQKWFDANLAMGIGEKVQL
jgi:hypothetical protein